ncbi:hypothetical protein V8B97DRAFT_186159 [Scleroderma yunnanense]
MDSPWDDDPLYVPEAGWNKISTEFTNSGYRQGIITGKESSLQEGFDIGFADVGVPTGRELGNLRGIASALVAFLAENHVLVEEARAISTAFAQIRFSDIAPPDIEAEQHAREHLDGNDTPAISHKREMENLEDMFSQLGKGIRQGRPTREDVAKLKERLAVLSTRLALSLNLASV